MVSKIQRAKHNIYRGLLHTLCGQKLPSSYFISHGFERCPYEYILYVKFNSVGDILILYLSIDNLIFMGNNPKLIYEFTKAMINNFQMINLYLMSYFLSLVVNKLDEGIFIA